MRVRDVAMVLGVAAATAGVVLLVCRPRTVSAENSDISKKLKVEKPAVRVDGVVATLDKKGDCEAGKKATVVVVAVNNSASKRTVSLSLRAMSQNPGAAFSRMMMPAKEEWSGTCTVTLNAGESRRTSVAIDAPVPAGKMVYVTMRAKVGEGLPKASGAAHVTLVQPKLPQLPANVLRSSKVTPVTQMPHTGR